MLFKTALFGLLATATAAANFSRCGTDEPATDIIQEALRQNREKVVSAQATIQVDLYIHVISRSGEAPPTASQVTRQVQVLNSNYNPYGIGFTLQGSDFTVNNAWASVQPGSSAESDMKRALRRGNYADLNLYFPTNLGGGILGICYFPTTVNSNVLLLDGCMVLAGSMPGGNVNGYNLGYTATHEVGHWFGLFHVFQGQSCSGSGDQIADTPQQSTATSGCPSSKDSCPSVSGLDSIHNYMDYSTDVCYTQFTANQKTRAFNMWNTYRAQYA